MATMVLKGLLTLLLLFMTLLLFTLPTTEAEIGVAYGQLGNNLPSPQQVVNLYKANDINVMRIYSPDQPTLDALKKSGIHIFLGVPNEDIQNLAENPAQAAQWARQYVGPCACVVRYIVVGNEVPQPIRRYIAPAMWNIRNALYSMNSLGDQIKVTPSIGTNLIKNSYPPSSGEFTDLPSMDPIIDFLKSNGSRLLVNVYPYFAYIANKKDISLDYALFTSPRTVVIDSGNGLEYQNLFDAIVDSVYASLAKRGTPNTRIHVSETGWPSRGGDSAANWMHARTYNRNAIIRGHIRKGPPLKPEFEMDICLFAMFDEDQKTGDLSEQHFGLFLPNQRPKYNISFTS